VTTFIALTRRQYPADFATPPPNTGAYPATKTKKKAWKRQGKGNIYSIKAAVHALWSYVF